LVCTGTAPEGRGVDARGVPAQPCLVGPAAAGSRAPCAWRRRQARRSALNKARTRPSRPGAGCL